jgi:cytochrome c
MDSFELNKVLGAVLGTCLALLSLNIAANALFSVHPPAKPGYEIAVPEQAAKGTQAGPAEADDPLPVRFAKADVGRGESSAKKCVSCHAFEKDQKTPPLGPNLWGIVGRAKAAQPGFNYSAAMRAQKGNWSLEDLDVYLKNPRATVPGTNMAFAGIPRASERADLLSFLNSKADNPAPLPKAAEAAPAPAQQAASPAPAAPPAAAPQAAPPAAPAPAEAPAAAAPPPAANPPAAPAPEAPRPQ